FWKAYSRTTEERHFDKRTLQQLRNIIQERAGDRFDVVDISTHTYALPLRRQPAEFLIVDNKYPNGCRPDVLDECLIMYDANTFTALLAVHGFKCFGQYVPKKWPDQNVFDISEHGKERESKEGYEAPVTLHVSSSAEQSMNGRRNLSSIIPSISFSVTLPHPAVLPLNRLLGIYFRIAPELPQAWALIVLWVRSLGLGTSTPGMKSVDDILNARLLEGRDIASQSLHTYVEELSPTCLALLFLIHLVEARRLPNLFDAVVPQENEPQHIWVPYTYHSSSRHSTHGHAQATRQMEHQCRQSYAPKNKLVTHRTAAHPQRNWVQTSTQIDTAFAGHAVNFKFGVKIPKLISTFFEYLSACAESRYYYYSLRRGARVPRDIPSRLRVRRQESTMQIEQMQPAEHTPQRQPESWKLDRLVVQDPFISTHNHAALLSSVTLHRITQCAKSARRWVVRGHPLWAMFGPHLKSSIVPNAFFQQPQNGADARTEACDGDNRQSLKNSDAAKTTDSSASAAGPTRESPPHVPDIGERLWGGLIGIQTQAADRARAESEMLQLLESERIHAKPNKGGEVAGRSSSSPRLKPPRHRAGKFSRGMHTSATSSLANDKTIKGAACNPKNANHPLIEVDFPPIDKNYNVSWNRDKTNTRDQLIRKVRDVIKHKYGPRYDVQPYGSSVYMVGHGVSTTDNGDLDLIVLDSKWPQGFTPEIDMKHLPLIYDTRKLARVMRYTGFTDIQAIARARVPIVKFTDSASGLNVDINVNERLGLLNTDLVKTYCDIVPGLRCLVSAIKKWARPRALNQPSASTFSSYALVLMTIAWLQTGDMAPKLQVGLQPMKANDLFWMRPPKPSKRIPCDTRYHKSTTWVAPPVSTSLDNLVGQWFRFWAGFQFSRHVIDIKRGGIYPRIPHFEGAADYDDVLRGPRSETRNNWSVFLGPDVDSTTMLEIYPISVVDPFIRSRNVTKGINVKSLNLFQAECKNAAELLKLGVDMTDIIDGFDLVEQDFNGYRKAGLQHVDNIAGSHPAAESLLREVSAPMSVDVPKFNAIHHWQPYKCNDAPQTSNHSKRAGLSVGQIPLSDALESSGVADGTIASRPRDAPEQVRDDEEGFGLKPSYYENNRRV
ncbi:hypothetical protein AZE42_04791, partial [Rhizopogon vesiculosus]